MYLKNIGTWMLGQFILCTICGVQCGIKGEKKILNILDILIVCNLQIIIRYLIAIYSLHNHFI